LLLSRIHTKGRSPIHLLVECLHLKLRFSEMWTLPDCSMVDGYSPYLIEGLRKFDLKMRGGTSGVSHDLDLCLHKVRRLVLMLVKSL